MVIIHDTNSIGRVDIAFPQTGSLSIPLKEGALAMQQTAINIVIARFAQLESLARTKITTIDDLERLQQLIFNLTLTRSQEETEQELLSLRAEL